MAEQAEVRDGRRLRSERSKNAFIEAALALLEEGNLVPTAQQIADRAGVGIRSFFRHFDDMETLFQAIDDNIRHGYETLMLGGDRTGDLNKRIEHAVLHRADVYESLSKIILSTSAQRWRYDVIKKNYARNQRGLRKDLEDWLPEVKTLSKAERELIDANTSFEMWHRLREHQGLGKKQSADIIAGLLKKSLN